MTNEEDAINEIGATDDGIINYTEVLASLADKMKINIKDKKDAEKDQTVAASSSEGTVTITANTTSFNHTNQEDSDHR
jgi:hypothetical protein